MPACMPPCRTAVSSALLATGLVPYMMETSVAYYGSGPNTMSALRRDYFTDSITTLFSQVGSRTR